MRGGGPLADTWEDDERPAEGERVSPADAAALEAAKTWRARAAVRRLQILVQATEPGHAEREMAFAAMADECREALEQLRAVIAVAENLKADIRVLRKAAERQRTKNAPAPRSGEPAGG
jgi:hypothetical protein